MNKIILFAFVAIFCSTQSFAENCTMYFSCRWEVMLSGDPEEICADFKDVLTDKGYRLVTSYGQPHAYELHISRRFARMGEAAHLVTTYKDPNSTEAQYLVSSTPRVGVFSSDIRTVGRAIESIPDCL